MCRGRGEKASGEQMGFCFRESGEFSLVTRRGCPCGNGGGLG